MAHIDDFDEKKLEESIEKGIKEISDLKVRFKVVALNHYLNEKKKLDTELDKEIKLLTKKYEDLSHPLFEKSNEIVSGRLPAEEELTNVEKYFTPEELAKKSESLVAEPITEYWFKVFKTNDILAEEIKPKEEGLLKHLIKIENVPVPNTEHDFELKFYFSANDHFTNEVLTKTFIMKTEEMPAKAVGSQINWKEGKNLTVKTIKKKQKNKKTGQTRVVQREVEDECFFTFFKTADPSTDTAAAETKDEDDEEGNPLQERLDIDFDIARTIIDEAIPYGLEYFLGIKINMGDDGDHEDLGDEDDDEDEESEDDKKPAPKGGKKKKH